MLRVTASYPSPVGSLVLFLQLEDQLHHISRRKICLTYHFQLIRLVSVDASHITSWLDRLINKWIGKLRHKPSIQLLASVQWWRRKSMSWEIKHKLPEGFTHCISQPTTSINTVSPYLTNFRPITSSTHLNGKAISEYMVFLVMTDSWYRNKLVQNLLTRLKHFVHQNDVWPGSLSQDLLYGKDKIARIYKVLKGEFNMRQIRELLASQACL